MIKKGLFFALLFMCSLALIAAPTPSTYVGAQWDAADANVDVDGYRFYCSTTVGDFTTTPIDIPDRTNNRILFSSLPCLNADGDYFITVTAYNSIGESGASVWLPVKSVSGQVPVEGLPDALSGFNFF